MMLQSSQILNSHHKIHTRGSPERNNYLNTRCYDKQYSTQTSVGDISQDLMKELALKNQLLNAQLAEYRLLVSNLNSRLEQMNEENRRLRSMVGEQRSVKLQTIQQELNSISQINTKSRRRENQQLKQQYYFHQISQLLNQYNLIDEVSWDAYMVTFESILEERSRLIRFVDGIVDMKETIEPGEASLFHLWQWLKKIGLNYYYLSNYSKRPRERKYLQKKQK